MLTLNLYGVLSDHVEFASSGHAGMVTMTLDLWKALGSPFRIEVKA